MPTYLIAPDSFKGSISAIQFCEIAQQVISKKQPSAKILCRPLSDGGEGFVDAFIYAGLAEEHKLWCSNPLGRKVKAKFAWMPESKTAIVEMAQASGLPLLRPDDRNPLQTHTTGTGQIIQAAIELGAKKIILGLGGSATNDGGVGALKALGIPFTNSQDKAIGLGGQALSTIDQIGDIPSHLLEIEWVLACDVTNPLLGDLGATTVFGPQKGLTKAALPILEDGLQHLANKILNKTGKNVIDTPGAGAAGGMAAGFMGLLNAKTQPGFDLLNQQLKLESLFENNTIDTLITGEGKTDEQTAFGKLPLRIASLAKQHQCKTIGLCGHLATTTQALPDFDALFSIIPKPMDEFTAIQHTPILLAHTLESVIGLLTD